MVTDVVMPKAGLTMVEGTIMEWLVPEGAQVKKGDAIMEYENEKNTIKCDALAGGILHITAKVGETVPIGMKIGVLADTQKEYQSLLKDSGTTAAPKASVQAGAGAPPVRVPRPTPKLAKPSPAAHKKEIGRASCRERVLRLV